LNNPREGVSAADRIASWRAALAVYTTPRILVMGLLGFSAGLPFVLVYSTLSVWMREAEVSRATIGFFSWLTLVYSLKVFWAPVIDSVRLPWFGRWLGLRRGWLLLAQLMIATGLIGMPTGLKSPPSTNRLRCRRSISSVIDWRCWSLVPGRSISPSLSPGLRRTCPWRRACWSGS
jgi:Acetyl-coenzyme A transporter 1